jgi:hypothetical protein
MRYIGDVHGKFSQYKNILKLGVPTIQLGDMGVGFRHCGGPRDGEFSANPPYDAMIEGGHRFIRGNHDNPSVCRNHTQCIKDGTVEGDVMYIGGALSIDREWRIEGYSWWADEELSQSELYAMMDIYEAAKPRIVVTHDCPEWVALTMEAMFHRGKLDISSRTRQAFDAMYGLHQPEVWCFGHWHHSFDEVINKTRFVCLAELEWKDI